MCLGEKIFKFFSTLTIAQGDTTVSGRKKVRDFFGVVTAGLRVIRRVMISDELAGAIRGTLIVVVTRGGGSAGLAAWSSCKD